MDGSWSTFNIRAGTPAQSVRVIASTNSPQTNVVQPAGCAIAVLPRGLPPNCAASRGGLFELNNSTTWVNQGWYSLNSKSTHYGFEANLGYNFNLNYGLDTLALDYQDGPNAPTLLNQTIAAYNLPNPLYLGVFGLGTQPVLYESFGNYSAPSFFTTLRAKNLIPSLSWSYTAGAAYRLSGGQYAQVVFGGYDTSRFQANDVQFRLSADVTRDIVVGIQSIIYSGTSTVPLLPVPIYAFIESTDPNIWLPLPACLLFEQAFGLTWDDSISKYLMNETLYTSNLAANPIVTFRLGVSTSGGSTASIAFPFAAFALKAAYPFVANSTYYFPLRRADNSTQYTLGRTFLQEAYLIVDYDRGNFTVGQCTWNQGAAPKISTILPPSLTNGTTGTDSKPGSSAVPLGAIIGSVIGAVFLVLLGLLGYWFWRKNHGKKESFIEGSSAPANSTFPGIYEADAQDWTKPTEGDALHQPTMGNGELAGDMPEVYQLQGDSRPMPPVETMGSSPPNIYELSSDKDLGIVDPASSLLRSTEPTVNSRSTQR